MNKNFKQDAINWMQENKLAYLKGYRDFIYNEKGKAKFGIFTQIPKEHPSDKLLVSFGGDIGNTSYPYGKFTIVHKEKRFHLPIPENYHFQTYCTLGVATFLYYYYDRPDLTYYTARKESHIIQTFSQASANEVTKALRKGKLNKYVTKVSLPKAMIHLYHNPKKIAIVAWQNKTKNGIGHVSTIINHKGIEECYLCSGEGKIKSKTCPYCFGYGESTMPIVFNVGGSFGEMPINKAFPGINPSELDFYLLK